MVYLKYVSVCERASRKQSELSKIWPSILQTITTSISQDVKLFSKNVFVFFSIKTNPTCSQAELHFLKYRGESKEE